MQLILDSLDGSLPKGLKKEFENISVYILIYQIYEIV